MKRVLTLLAALSLGLLAQTSDTAYFVAALSPANEVPAITGYDASGTCVLYAHVMRNAQGQIVSGSVDFVVMHTFPDLPMVVGLHVHTGGPTVNGPVSINSGIGSGANAVTVATSRGVIERQGQVAAADMNGITALRGLFENPQGYYCNLHTPAYPGGIIRGQMHRAERSVFMGRMSPRNEVPAITDFNASGVGTVESIRAYDQNGRYVGGIATFSVDYTVPETTTFTGLHIHTGAAGVNGPVRINTGLGAGAASVESAAGGSGNITRRVEVPLTPIENFSAFETLFDAPETTYINLHSSRYPGGVIRAQLSRTETMHFPLTMSPANEVPAITGLDATGNGSVWISALRERSGAIAAANVVFDINYRFPGEARFTGLHIHDGKAGANGPVTINSGLRQIDTTTGFGNIWLPVNIGGGQALTSLNSLLVAPENHYANLHTAVNPGGAVRMQMGPEVTRTPVITEAISAVSDISVRNAAPGGAFTVFGNDLVRVPTQIGVGIEGNRLPVLVNGVGLTLAGADAPLLTLGTIPGGNPNSFIVAQVPFETTPGQRAVVVKTPAGTSAPRDLTIAAQAPAIFFDAEGAIVLRASNLEQVNPPNAARAGEALAVLSTGLGQTTPALQTGEIPSDASLVTQPVSVTVGGQNATVVGSAVVPGLPGLYLTLFQMPNVPAGNAQIVMRVNGVASNISTIPVR
jgi:uncharacterized protein (TIGR03437 family)